MTTASRCSHPEMPEERKRREESGEQEDEEKRESRFFHCLLFSWRASKLDSRESVVPPCSSRSFLSAAPCDRISPPAPRKNRNKSTRIGGGKRRVGDEGRKARREREKSIPSIDRGRSRIEIAASSSIFRARVAPHPRPVFDLLPRHDRGTGRARFIQVKKIRSENSSSAGAYRLEAMMTRAQ